MSRYLLKPDLLLHSRMSAGKLFQMTGVELWKWACSETSS